MHILVIEDEAQLCSSIAEGLRLDGYEVDTCMDGNEGLDLCLTEPFDLILLDLNLPGMDGLSILQQLRAENSSTPVIILSARTQIQDKVEGLDLGANDYLTKPFGVMELISRVKALLRRVGGMEEEKFIRIGLLFIDDEKHVAYVDDKPVELTFKEYELLRYLAINQGIVLSRDNLMEKVWSLDYEGESRTLDVHSKTLRQKLGVVGCYIKTVRNVGYYLDVDDRG